MYPLIFALVGFFLGCQVTSWKYEADIATADSDRAFSQRESDRRNRFAQGELQSEIARLNDELSEKQNSLTNERAGVNTGERVVYVAAKCPSTGGDEKPVADSTSGNTGRPARLEPVAGQNYMDYKRAYQDQLSTLRKCVAFARATLEANDP